MPRTKRKRTETDPNATAPLTTRRRRTAVGNEPNNNSSSIENTEPQSLITKPISQITPQGETTTTAATDVVVASADTSLKTNNSVQTNQLSETNTSNNNTSNNTNINKKPTEGKKVARKITTVSQANSNNGGDDHANDETDETIMTSQNNDSGIQSEMKISQQQSTSNNTNQKSRTTRQNIDTTNTNKNTTQQTTTTGINNNNASDNDNINNPVSREARIRSILEHRKLLLKRIRQGRTVAQRRLDELYTEDPTRKNQTDEEEINAFQQLAKTVTSKARKHARQVQHQDDLSSITERRSSVSLRRGSSVGKRMNAVLSSLGGTTSNAEQKAQQQQQQAAAAAATAAVTTTTTISGRAGVVGQISSSSNTGGVVMGNVPTADAAITSVDPTAVISATTAAPKPVASKQLKRQRPNSAAGRGGGRKQMHTVGTVAMPGRGIPENNATATVNNRISNSIQQQQQQYIQPQQQKKSAVGAMQVVATTAPTQNVGFASGKKVAQRQAPPPAPPRVICPETAALREKRDNIRIKLATMLQERKRKSDISHGYIVDSPSRIQDRRNSSLSVVSNLSSRSRVTQTVRKVQSSASPQNRLDNRQILQQHAGPHRPLWEGPDPPPKLPIRRKTHWDTLLEEMRWMATDFIEERKWKCASARCLARSVSLKVHECNSERSFRSNSKNNQQTRLDEVANDESKDETMETDKDADRNNGEKSIHLTRMIFSDVTDNDIIASKAVAKQLSEHLNDFIRSAEIDGTDRHNAISSNNEKRQDSDANNDMVDDENSKENNPETKDSGAPEVPDVEFDINFALERATEYMEGLIKAIQSRDVKNDKEENDENVLSEFGFSLSSEQTKVIEKIEMLWNEIATGASIRGPIASGKTVAVCSILWRNRSSGPQLVICSFASKIRWFHEIKKFSDVRVRSFRSVTHFKELLDSTDPPSEGDVFVCTITSILRMEQICLNHFQTVVLDCRYPSGFDGSHLSAVPTGPLEVAAPAEFSDVPWWSKIVTSMARKKTKRLIIEGNVTGGFIQVTKGLSKRQMLEIVALRTGFLCGVSAFSFPGYSVPKAIMLWARKRIKRKSTKEGSKSQRVAIYLTDIAKEFECVIDSVESSEVIKPHWEMDVSTMPLQQRQAYDAVCRETCMVLSRKIRGDKDERFDQFSSLSAVLVQLRRHCCHSDVPGIFKTVQKQTKIMGNSTITNNPQDPSQPDLDLAQKILSGSCKFQRLVSILVDECGFNVPNEKGCNIKKLLTEMKIISSRRKKNGKSNANVVILASLPEVRVLVSALLHSVGLFHELLHDTSVAALFTRQPANHSDNLSWTKSQMVLSSFNGEVLSLKPRVSIVVSSLVSVAGDHCGLRIEGADVIISVDEDWSGREEILMKSLLTRSALPFLDKVKTRLVKLVAENSIEEYFLNIAGKLPDDSWMSKIGQKGSYLWPVSSLGLFSVPTSQKHKAVFESEVAPKSMYESEMGYFGFPGHKILQCRDQDLEEVLCAVKKLPRLCHAGPKPKFLPSAEVENIESIDLEFLHSLVVCEEASSSPFSENQYLTESSPDHVSLSEVEKSLLVVDTIDDATPLRLYLKRSFAGLSNQNPVPLNESGLAPKTHSEITTDEDTKRKETPKQVAAQMPEDTAPAFLVYSPPQNNELSSTITIPGFSAARSNFYSSAFCLSRSQFAMHDGNQGSEVLIYLPPLFPRIQQCAALAKSDVSSLRVRSMASREGIEAVSRGTKRKMDDNTAIEEDSKLTDNVAMQQEPKRVHFDGQRVITEDEASHSDAASVLMDLSDDYGLAGMGAIPLPRDSALSAAGKTIETSFCDFSGDRNNWLTSTPYCDTEESDAGKHSSQSGTDLKQMILLVSRKRTRGYNSLPYGRNLPMNSSGWNGIPTTSQGSTAYHEINGATKNAASTSAFSLLDSSQMNRPVIHPNHSSRDIHRLRLLSTLRHSGIGSSMFEAPIFRVACVRVRNKVSDRLLRHGWAAGVAFDVGPGLPLLVSKQQAASTYRGVFEVDPNLWTSVVKRLRNRDAQTGEEAMELSLAQRSTLRRSLVSPCRVDFGPFRCGFISSTSGATAASTPRPRIGVSLPMGVKISASSRDFTNEEWNPVDDRRLHNAAIQFGMNWILAALVLSGFQDVGSFSQSESKSKHQHRAARVCRDRWQKLVRSDPSMLIKARNSERSSFYSDDIPEEGNVGRRLESQHHDENGTFPRQKVTFLLASCPEIDSQKSHPKQDSADIGQADKSQIITSDKDTTALESTSKKRFSAFQRARTHRQEIPIALPGAASGNPPAIGQNHPSHEQAVQLSSTFSWTRGHDMWPLQFLDAAERQRAISVAPVAVGDIVTSSPRRGPNSPIRSQSSGLSSNGSSSHVNRRVASTSAVSAQRPSGPSDNFPGTVTTKAPSRSASASAKPSAVTKQSFAPPPPPAPAVGTSSTAPSTGATSSSHTSAALAAPNRSSNAAIKSANSSENKSTSSEAKPDS